MKVVIAPDKFKGTLTAMEAAQAVAAGWARARPADDLVLAPIADGGTGSLDLLEAVIGGAERMWHEVAGARGRATQAAWLHLPDGRAFVEAAQAVGLDRLEPAQRNPRLATSYGVGQLVAAAASTASGKVLVGLGGSATVDGGGGLATALGHRLLRSDGNRVKVGGEFVVQVERIEPAGPLPSRLVIASDVMNPLLGPDGAARVYGPQKGASGEDVELLETAIARFADVVERDLPGGPWRDRPGAGAAGGLGFALMAFCGAEVRSGAEVIGELIGFDREVDAADVVVTGEGQLDRQTAWGKGPSYVAARGRDAGAQVLAIAGVVEDGAGDVYDQAVALGPDGLRRPAELVEQRAAELAAAVGEGDG